jgi:hypothetical protein
MAGRKDGKRRAPNQTIPALPIRKKIHNNPIPEV